MAISAGATTQVSKEEYLSTSYHPDREWADGVLMERNVGTQQHSLVQGIIFRYLSNFRRSHRIETFVEARLQVGERTRIPDVMVLKVPYTKGKITADVPLIVVEVMSADDTFDEVLEKCFEYEALTVPYILVLDPDSRRMYRFSGGSLTATIQVKVEFETGNLEINVNLFAEMDQ